jgi:UPF0755 protein
VRPGIAFVGALVLVGAVAASGYRGMNMPSQETENHLVVEVAEGASFKEVTYQLAQKGLIVSPFWFRMLGKVQGAERKIQPGEYDLHTAMRPVEILSALVKGKVIQYSVLIPEGLTAQQIGKLLEEAGIAKEADIAPLVAAPAFAKSLGLEGQTLEGYLFPDTYHFRRGTKPEDVLRAMVHRFQEAYTPELQAQAAALGLSERHVVTLASIIEKETGQEDERPLISAVFHNRLKKGLPLQSDPTVIYGIRKFSGNLTRKDLGRRTPFNTYTSRGLPPSPIANPGLKSIQAAVSPAPVKYLYFVSKNDGSHHFSATLAEHNRAVERYQKRGVRRAAPRKAA